MLRRVAKDRSEVYGVEEQRKCQVRKKTRIRPSNDSQRGTSKLEEYLGVPCPHREGTWPLSEREREGDIRVPEIRICHMAGSTLRENLQDFAMRRRENTYLF